MLTGQLVFRDTTKQPHHVGHKLMMVCGVISVPHDFCGKGEHQYVVTGCVGRGNDGLDNSDIHLHVDTGVDLTEKLKGMCLNSMITSPMWRV